AGGGLAEQPPERAPDLVQGESLARPDNDQVGVEDVRQALALCDADDRHVLACGGAKRLLTGRADPDQRGGLRPRVEPLANGARVSARPELAREDGHELTRAVDRERPGLDLAAPQLPEQRQREGHRRRRRPRAWIACRIPRASRLAIIAEPPTETNGSGMPVIGAIPIVIPTLTNTWKRNPQMRPAAT